MQCTADGTEAVLKKSVAKSGGSRTKHNAFISATKGAAAT
jgi:hypothetical protein